MRGQGGAVGAAAGQRCGAGIDAGGRCGQRGRIGRERRPGDAVATVDMTVMPYRDYYDCAWTAVDTVESLETLERSHPRTWIVFCTPTRMKAAQPDIWARIEREYRVQATYWGTLGGSEVIVALREAVAK